MVLGLNNVMNLSRFAIFLLFCSIPGSTGSPAFELIQGNNKFQDASKTANDQIIAVNEAAGQEIIKHPEEQKGVLRLGVSPTPSVTPSSSVTPSPSVTTSPSSSPSVSPSPSVSVSASVSLSSARLKTADPSQSSAPQSIECVQIPVNALPASNSDLSTPTRLIQNVPSLPYFGEDRSVCLSYVNVPENAKTYTAAFSADGNVNLYISFEDYPWSSYSNGVFPECELFTWPGGPICEGDLKGAEKLYLKLEGYDGFSNAEIEVSFDIISPTPSPTPGAIICPVVTFNSVDSLQPVDAPLEIPANSLVGSHYGTERSICSFYAKVPENSRNFTANLWADGWVDLFVALEGAPSSDYSAGVDPICISGRNGRGCSSELNGEEEFVYLKIEGYEEFSRGTISVDFDVPN